MRAKFLHTLRNAVRPGYGRVIAGKAMRRFSPIERSRAEAIRWAREIAVTPERWCTAVDADLWAEAKEFGRELHARAEVVRAETGIAIGGGARAELLYFLTRRSAPEIVVETGVAHGYSSAAFLAAIRRNQKGRLYSSDFPYFRDPEPERQIGVLVPADGRADWTLHVAGDERNLPRIVEAIDHIDLLHYDSDKTYRGRGFAVDLLGPLLTRDAVFVMDDIQDNVYFRDLTRRRDEPFVVLGHTNAFVGAFGVPTRAELGI
jgi:predicted O-methyltransferase YrrM